MLTVLLAGPALFRRRRDLGGLRGGLVVRLLNLGCMGEKLINWRNVHHVTPGMTLPSGAATILGGLLGNGFLAWVDSSTHASNGV